jgi:2-hydroxychromene-2-carboxylate isomerase
VKAPGLGPRKKKNYANDLRHWAQLCGAEFSPKAREHRPKPRLMTQAALVAKDEGRIREFHYPAFRARWAEGRDIADAEVVRELLAGAGLDADAALERAQGDAMRERLDADSRAAVERGVFGAPTLFVGDEMFWGNDRFELVRHYLLKAQR